MAHQERIGSCTLILADCREVLPELRADVILTDPVWPNCPKGTVPGSDDPWELWREACRIFPTVARIITVMRTDSDPRFLNALPSLPFLRTILLPYAVPHYLGRVLGGDEMAYWFGTPPASAPNRRVVPGRAPAAQPGSKRNNKHPMPRAQAHFDWLAGWCSDPGETILDPFMGSGTTLIGAAQHGRKAIGIEVKPEYFAIACQRVEDAMKQGNLLTAAGG